MILKIERYYGPVQDDPNCWWLLDDIRKISHYKYKDHYYLPIILRGVKMELRDYIAFTLFMDEIDWTDFFQGYPNELSLEEYIEIWMEDKMPSLNEPHCGDCTKVPAPCTRCQTEEYYTEADQIIRAIKDYEDAKRKEISD